MTALVAGAVLAGFVISLPYWLPSLIIAARVRIFAALNGAEGITIPGSIVDAERFKRVYADPAAGGRSRGAGLSDLFWYWLSPGAHLHQEHLESGERYREVARTTRRILARQPEVTDRLAARCAARYLDKPGTTPVRLVRLRDLMMPIWADFYYELVFNEPSDPLARKLIVANANDVATALKCCGLRHMGRRNRLTAYLEEKLERHGIPYQLPGWLTLHEKALYLQGTFFNTAVVQSSEAMAHLLLAIAQHQDVQARLVAEPADGYLERVMDEALRMYPLFGIAHRITTDEITVGPAVFPAGSVLLFNYQDYHRSGFVDPQRFDPDRWLTLSTRDAHHIPFGVAANRPCPAQGFAPVTMRAVAREVLSRYALMSSAAHTRSMPNRGPCLLVSRSEPPPSVAARLSLLAWMRVRDRWEDVWRSLVQLVLGSYMVWHARRLRLCQRYFEEQQPEGARTT